MTRFALGLLLVSGVAFAETQADIATRENDEGKQLMFAQKYADASAKFRDAAARKLIDRAIRRAPDREARVGVR